MRGGHDSMPYHCAIAPINDQIVANPGRRGVMATFEAVGFLSDELDQWKHAAQEAYAGAFGYAYRANGMALRVMKAIPMKDISEEMKWAIAAFARALGAFQCSVLMIECGAMAEARALARLCAETLIVAKGLVNVPGTLEILRESDAEHSIRAITNIIGLNAGNPQPDEQSLERLKGTMAELELAFPKRRSLNYRTLALSTGLELFYEIAYRYTSGDGAHATLGAFVRHIKAEESTHGYFFGPDIAGMASTLLTVSVAITELIDLAVNGMGYGEAAAELRDLKLHWLTIRPDLEAMAAEEPAE
jgi:hypothetical protein